jgi:hypothetical protein
MSDDDDTLTAPWPPTWTRCPWCQLVMRPAPRPERLHDRVAQYRCLGCDGRHCRIAGDDSPIYCPSEPDNDVFGPLTTGHGPLPIQDGPFLPAQRKDSDDYRDED